METEKESSHRKGVVTISKGALAELPACEFPGKIFIVDSLDKLPRAIEILKSSPLIGFDTETRPSFKKGQQYKVSLVQLSTPEVCFLFRINQIGFPVELKQILEDDSILKIGVSIHDDFHNLAKITEFTPQSFIDLQSYVKDFRIIDNSLARIYAILFNQRISKGQRLTNWEAESLSEAQQAYAALDAYACIKIYNHLKEGKFNPQTSPYLTFPEVTLSETNPSVENPSEG